MQDSNHITVPQIRVSDGPNDYSPTVDRDDSPLEQWGAARPRSSESEGMSHTSPESLSCVERGATQRVDEVVRVALMQRASSGGE